MDHDVVVIGSRVAGAATALLLARAGLSVVAVDRARFPSDTLSSHQLHLPGVACLHRWGLLDRLVATGVPPTRDVRFDPGPAVIEARFRPYDGIDVMFSPRRTVLDSLLVDAAREAGADIVEGVDVEELVGSEGAVTGVRGRVRGSSTSRSFSGRVVVGADGKRSWVARAVGGSAYHDRTCGTSAFYAYWSGLDLHGGEIYSRHRRLVGAWPTHDDLVVSFVELPTADLDAFRAQPETGLLAALDLAGDLGARARAATKVGPVRGTSDLPHLFRQASGPGWALVGDAGLVMDPVTGQGISHALVDAERLAAAVVAGFGGARPLEAALADYQRQRDVQRLPMADFTADLASFSPRPGGDLIFRTLANDPEEAGRFLDVLSGVRSPREYFSLRNLRRVLGWRGAVQLVRSSRGRQAA